MKLKELLNEDDAVSPVIGVILMVAITVILAAVIATFVLGLGESIGQSAPSSSFTFDVDDGASNSTMDDYGINETNGGEEFTNIDGEEDIALLTITHAGGPTIEADKLANTGGTYGSGSWTESDKSRYESGDDVSAGSGFDMWIDVEDSVQVTWSDDGDSAILQTYDGR